MVDLNKFKSITTVFVSRNLKVQVRVSREGEKEKKKVKIIFLRKIDAIQGKPTLLAILKLL